MANAIEKISDIGLIRLNKERKENRVSVKNSQEIKEKIDSYIENKNYIFVNPSSSSAILPIPGIDPQYRKLEGKCIRELYLNKLAIPETDPTSSEGLRRMNVGNIIEEEERNNIYRAGYGKYHNLKFIHVPSKKSNFVISGEIDIVLEKTEEENSSELFPKNILKNDLGINTILCEVKSFYGYAARKEIYGNTTIEGKPKISHILQATQYLKAVESYNNKNKGLTIFLEERDGIITEKKVDIDTNMLLFYYIDRSDLAVKEHILKVKNNTIIVNGKDMISYGLNVDEIYRNYEAFYMYYKNKKIPPRISRYTYEDEQIREMINKGLLSKSKIDLYKRNKAVIGDYQCLYCNYKSFCLGDTPWIKESRLSDEYIMDIIKTSFKDNIDG